MDQPTIIQSGNSAAPPSGSRTRSYPDSQLGRVATGCALAVMVLGLAVMVGWLLGIEPPKRLLPQLTTMKFNTALGFLLAYKRRSKGLIFQISICCPATDPFTASKSCSSMPRL